MTDQVDYALYHVRAAARNCADARGKRVLVVGCNRGWEVSTFLDEGASKVWGIDVLADVGAEYPCKRAHCLRMSAESMELDNDMFDVVSAWQRWSGRDPADVRAR